jgi:beta-lactamase regulating signal transducer with metallopeptidase domain
MTMTQALGWALVDSLWQNALAAAGLAVLLAVVPVRAARVRYGLATITLALMLAFPLATAVRLGGTSPWTSDPATARSPVNLAPTTGPGPRAVPATTAPAPATPGAPVAVSIRAALEPALPWVVLVWFGGVVALSLRLASGWLMTRQLGRVGTSSVPDSCIEAVTRLAARLRITRPVRVLESAVMQVPAVIGWLRPVILLPASALTGLTPLQLDALLAHELAHVRRYDYVVNLLQSVVETLLFYHPAVWWVSGRVREEREHCCDDLAVAVCGDAHVYATALLGMERLRVATPAFALAASGGGRAGSLMRRIRRLVAPVPTEIFPRWIAGVVAVTFALAGGAHLAGGQAALVDDNTWSRVQDTTLRRIQALRDPDARENSVKELARTHDREALATLIAIARQDRDEDVQREAVEALGTLQDGAGVDALIDIAHTHPNADVRREAVKTIGEAAPADLAIVELQMITHRDRDEDVQQEAVEALGHVRAPQTLIPLAHLARAHPSAAVREEALKQYVKVATPEAARTLLTNALANDRASSVREEAVEYLSKLPDGIGIPALVEAARRHPASDVRAESEKRLADLTSRRRP